MLFNLTFLTDLCWVIFNIGFVYLKYTFEASLRILMTLVALAQLPKGRPLSKVAVTLLIGSEWTFFEISAFS